MCIKQLVVLQRFLHIDLVARILRQQPIRCLSRMFYQRLIMRLCKNKYIPYAQLYPDLRQLFGQLTDAECHV
jgi:hypothetical protein